MGRGKQYPILKKLQAEKGIRLSNRQLNHMITDNIIETLTIKKVLNLIEIQKIKVRRKGLSGRINPRIIQSQAANPNKTGEKPVGFGNAKCSQNVKNG